MKTPAAATATIVFFVLAPGVVAGLGPWSINRWRLSSPAWDPQPLRWIGGALIAAGLAVLVESFARFVAKGHGTPAPPLPTETLVVSGLYRHVRNPMYLALLAIIAGQALLLGDAGTLVYAACVLAGFTAFVMLYEEPTLRRRYGQQYAEYCAHVKRWWPRRRG